MYIDSDDEDTELSLQMWKLSRTEDTSNSYEVRTLLMHHSLIPSCLTLQTGRRRGNAHAAVGNERFNLGVMEAKFY